MSSAATPPFGIVLRSPDDPLTPALRRDLASLARQPVVLVACDYDGTISPIAERPHEARPLPEAVTALRALALLPSTMVSVVSGRGLRDLAALSRLPHEITLVGSHGSEFDVDFVDRLPPEVVALREQLIAHAYDIAHGHPGVLVEAKPTGVAVHHRMASPDDASAVAERISAGPALWPGVHVRTGHAVIELSVVPSSKGDAIEALRHRAGASATLMIGDDVTDEDAFARLAGPDVGIRVGPGPTLATHRVASTVDVARVLAYLLEERRAWLLGGRAVPIERHSILADGRSVALLTPDATVTWWCPMRPDGQALFADLLGGPTAGSLTVTPAHGAKPIGQRYLPGTLTLETRWAGVRVIDYLDASEVGHAVTLVRVIEASTPVQLAFRPRPDFGRVPCRLEPSADGDALSVIGSPEPLVLRAPGVRWTVTDEGDGPTARATVTPGAMPLVLELRCGTEDIGPHPVPEPERRAATGSRWQDWLAGLRLPTRHREVVARSALTLKALCHAPTGSILAAATTSLPEDLGGVRNWDYRYCWIRDAAMTARTLVSLGSPGEAEAFLGWLHRVLERVEHPERLHPLYGLEGHELGPEAVIDTLPGYAGSRPVRVGNAAEHQVQLDVFGPVVELVAALVEAGRPVDEDTWEVVVAMVEAVERRWREPDHGIWEVRRPPRHHVHGKVLCWVAVDRAVRIAERLGRQIPPTWPALAAEIRADVLAHGWNPRAQAFTAAYGDDDLDAAALHVALSGMLDPADHRVAATIGAIELALRNGPTVYRYRTDDGLPGTEGGFHVCAAWLAQAYVLAGRLDDARALFGQLVDLVGPTGLLPEQYDPLTERHLGNHPQAYSHLGLIDTALLLERHAPTS